MTSMKNLRMDIGAQNRFNFAFRTAAPLPVTRIRDMIDGSATGLRASNSGVMDDEGAAQAGEWF